LHRKFPHLKPAIYRKFPHLKPAIYRKSSHHIGLKTMQRKAFRGAKNKKENKQERLKRNSAVDNWRF
jgi:hypothetical protein